MSDDRITSLERRRVVAATAGLVGLAGCSGGNSGNSGDDGGGGDSGGIYEGGDFTCASINEASFSQFDASGTALLFDFEYPDVFDSEGTSGTPATRVTFLRDFGGNESYTNDTLRLSVVQSKEGSAPEDVNTEGEAVTEVEFGDRSAYLAAGLAGLGPTDQPNEGLFQADIPYEIDGSLRYFPVQFQFAIDINTKDRSMPQRIVRRPSTRLYVRLRSQSPPTQRRLLKNSLNNRRTRINTTTIAEPPACLRALHSAVSDSIYTGTDRQLRDRCRDR